MTEEVLPDSVQLKNGRWTGVLGELINGTADFSLVLTQNYARSGVIRFIRIYAIDPFVFVTSPAQPLPQWLSIFRPFETPLWLVTIASTVISGCLAFMFTRLHPQPERRFSLGLSIFNSYGAMCENAQHRLPANSIAAQTFLGWWWLYCIIILTAYKSSLVAMMTVPSFSKNINSLEELASSSFSWGITNTYGSDHILFQTSPMPVYQRLFASMQYHNIEDSFVKLLTERYAFISWRSNLQAFIAERYSDSSGRPLVHMAKEAFSPENFAWGFRPKAPFVHKFDAVMQRLTEAGLIRKWELDTVARRRREGRSSC
ncbi:glutamate receptor ionotropic, kainate 5-like [Pollicipes pollicipes]|uniref:glutamate receptor ionotropic, kainate 5-like n=1 Tax=Pollicipes pollicipes TaxID=41117 RepID=UPI00188574D8|nr:glutamate receptor ionotropic, kainate 5-like [Pollicipes pollicipes]